MRSLIFLIPMIGAAAIIPADITEVRPGPITVTTANNALTVRWPDEANRQWTAEFSLDNAKPVISQIALNGRAVIRAAYPQYWVTTGKRTGRAGFDEFLEFPGDKPEGSRHFWSDFKATAAKAKTIGNRVEVFFPGLKMGIFSGGIAYTFYPGSRLVQQEAVASTQEPMTAYLYDTGIRMAAPPETVRPGKREIETPVTYYNMDYKLETVLTDGPDRRPAYVRYRAIAAKQEYGSLAVFPAPHQYYLLRDYTTNMGFVWHHAWYGRIGPPELAIGVRQLPDDGSPDYPWMNAPPGTVQRMSLFMIVSDRTADSALDEAVKFTNKDKFPAISGYKALAAHFHWGFTMKAMDRGENMVLPAKQVLSNMGVDIAMTNDFHSDGHPEQLTEVRLKELETYYRICKKQSDSKFLLIPTEEANTMLGGHWTVAFPKQVLWFKGKKPGEPFVGQDPKYGKVYHVGSPEEVVEMISKENGFLYTTHPRTKSSVGYPDRYLKSPFFADPHFIGTGWKQLPSDLSTLRQGVRAFKVLDDINNMGLPKRLFAEVDTFNIGLNHELYPQLNINYVKLNQVPSFDNYGQVTDAILKGDYFMSTGEVLLPDVKISTASPSAITATVQAQWSFPLAFGTLVWGDGKETHIETFPLTETRAYGKATFEWKANAPDWKWARVELWDVAGNGGFINPVRR